MAENTTTLLEKWQKQQQEHPEWAPSPEDLLYFIHGTGSDRDRLFPLSMIYDGSRQIEYLNDSGSLTSEQIVNVYKSGRLPVVRMGGGGSGTQTTLYFYPKSIYYKDEGYGSNINRDCLFFAVTYVKESGEDFYRMKVQTRRYYNIPVEGYGEQTDHNTVDLTYPESLKTDKVEFGDGWAVKKVSAPGGDAFAIGRVVEGSFVDVLILKNDGSKITVVPSEMDLGSWTIDQEQGSIVFKTKNGGTSVTGLSISNTGEVGIPANLSVTGTNGISYTGIGYISGSQQVGSHNFVRLTSGTTYDITSLSVAERVPVYVMNKTSNAIAVSTGSRSVNIPSMYMAVFMKYDNDWYATIGNNV